MTKEQFINLIKAPSTINLNLIADLEDITTRFPYFQNAHLLLVKQYHGHENIRYESYLRKASAYAGNRQKLFRLIKDQPLEVIHIENSKEASVLNKTPDVSAKEVDIDSGISEESVIRSAASGPIHADSEANQTKPIESNQEETQEEQSRIDHPLSILEKRLKEIATETAKDGDSEAEPEESQLAENSSGPNEDSINKDENDTVPLIPSVETSVDDIKNQLASEESSESVNKSPAIKSAENQNSETDAVRNLNIENNAEDDSIKGEPDSKPQKNDYVQQNEKHTFSEWLKIKSLPVIPTENIHEYLKSEEKTLPDSTNKDKSASNNLIEEFIEKEPRIVPAKSDFYSPGNMARKSAQENSDLVSETLARIYAQQGNVAKAIVTYKKLMLKKPEKSGYFAALITELEEKSREEDQKNKS